MTKWIQKFMSGLGYSATVERSDLDRRSDQRRQPEREQRSEKRWDVSLPVELMVEERKVPGVATSLSAGGIFIRCEEQMSNGTFVMIHLTPPDAKDVEDVIVAEARIAYQTEHGLGARFVGLTLTEMHRLTSLMRAANEATAVG